MTARIRIGYSRSTSTGSREVTIDTLRREVATIVADPDILNAFYYPHPAAPAVWVKGDWQSHRDLVARINEGAR